MMRPFLILFLCLLAIIGLSQNQRVNTLTATTGITNNGVYKHPTGAGLGLVFTSDAAGNATWQPDTGGSLWTNNTSDNSSVVYLKAFPTNFQIRPYWTNGAMLTLGPYSTNWFDTAFGDPRQYYSIISARDVSRGDVDRNNFWFSTGLDTVGNVYGSIDGSTRTNFAILTIDAVGMPNGGTRRVQAGYDSTTTILNVVGETGSTLINDGRMTISTSITNLGTYQHTNGAFTGAVFLSTNNSGDAMWSTNIPNLVISNTTLFSTLISNAFINQAFITNLFTTGGSVGASLWTNDGVVLRPKPTNGEIPNFAIRGGVWSNTVYGHETTFNNQTNVGRHSIAWGSNVLARGAGNVVFGAINLIETNSTYTSILGGSNILVLSNAHMCVVGGGRNHIINFAATHGVIAGGFDHNIYPFVEYATISGGNLNEARTNYATLSGGLGNTVRGQFGTIGGGLNNDVNAEKGTVAGGEDCNVLGRKGFIGGGFQNSIHGTDIDNFSVLVGGDRCAIGTGTTQPSISAFVGGGRVNVIEEQSDYAILVGGDQNTLGGQATNSIIVGGAFNSLNDGSINAFIAGGLRNSITTTFGDYSYVIGHSNRATTNFAFAIGVELTNVTVKTLDLGFNDFSKTTFGVSSNEFRTNTVFGGVVSYKPNATAQSLAAATAITHFQSKVRVVGSGGAVTLTSAPTITDGQDGDWLLIIGTSDANTVTIQDEDSLANSNVHLGAASRLLGNRDTLLLSFDATDGSWQEVAFTNN